MKKDLLEVERDMLIQLGFHVEVEAPHKFILSYLRILDAEKNQEFAQKVCILLLLSHPNY